MKTTPQALTFFVLVLLLIGSEPVLASAEPVARVVVAAGNVTARNEDSARSLERRASVYEGETVMTGVDSRAQLRFNDGALLSLDPQTELVIETYRRNPDDPEKSRALLKMVEGGLRTITGAIAEEFPEGYEVETPVAGIGVRGTDFQAVIEEEQLAVAAWQGSVRVNNEAGELLLGDGLPYRFAVVQGPDQIPGGVLQAPSVLTSAASVSEAVSGKQGSSEASEEADGLEVTSGPSEDEGAVSNELDGDGAGLALNELSTDAVRETLKVPDEQLNRGGEVGLPEWFAEPEQRNRRGAYTFGNPFRFGTVAMRATNANASDAQNFDGLTLSRDLSVDCCGYLLPPDVLDAANEVAGFPVIWGRWNDVDEMFEFSTATDEQGNPIPGELSVRRGPPSDFALEVGAWLSSTAPSLSLSEVSAIRSNQTIRFGSGSSFATGPVQILDSQFDAGLLVESESSMDFSVSLDDGSLTDGALEVVVAGDGFQEVWSWSFDPSLSSSGQIGEEESRVVFAGNVSVSRTDGSFNPVAGETQIALEGFIVESDESVPEGDTPLGFIGAGGLVAEGEGDGPSRTAGTMLIVLPEK